MQCREPGLQLAACKLIGAMLLDGSDYAPLRLAQVAASAVPGAFIDLILCGGDETETLLLQLYFNFVIISHYFLRCLCHPILCGPRDLPCPVPALVGRCLDASPACFL